MIELGVAFIGGCSALAVALVPAMLRQHRDTAAIKDQVKNSHGTNLRDDLDRALHGITHLIDSVGLIRTDMAWERRERMDIAARVDRLEGAA